MTIIYNKIPVKLWVRGTIDKMDRFSKTDIDSWGNYWLSTYFELGGLSRASGSKGCPLHAAYGLWRLGRIERTNIPYSRKPITEIKEVYGKNVAYAVIALEILEKNQAAITNEGLWAQVQTAYKNLVHEMPANSKQGAVDIARGLFVEDEIVSKL